jgi:hypothetical protein
MHSHSRSHSHCTEKPRSLPHHTHRDPHAPLSEIPPDEGQRQTEQRAALATQRTPGSSSAPPSRRVGGGGKQGGGTVRQGGGQLTLGGALLHRVWVRLHMEGACVWVGLTLSHTCPALSTSQAYRLLNRVRVRVSSTAGPPSPGFWISTVEGAMEGVLLAVQGEGGGGTCRRRQGGAWKILETH